MNNDYILLIDEYGQPYLAHAWLRKGESHKYLKKIDNYYGKGKHLYLYTQKEVDAFQNPGKRKGKRNLFQRIKDRSRDILGWDERSDRETAKEAQNNARDAYGAANRRIEQIKNQQRGNQSAASAASIEQKNAAKNYRKTTKEYRDAQDAYDKTLLGTIDKIKNHRNTPLSEVRQYNAEQESKDQNKANYNVFRDSIKIRNRRHMRENNPELLKTIDKVLDELFPTKIISDNAPATNTATSATKPKAENNSTTKSNQTYRERRIDEIDTRLEKIKTHDLKSAKAEYSRALKELGVARKNHGEDSEEVKTALEKVAIRRNEVEALNKEEKKLMNEKDRLNQQ